MPITFLLEEFCSYSQHLKGHSQQTIIRYRENISFYCSYSGVTTATDINQKNVLQFFLFGRKERRWRARTFRTYYMSLHVFFAWCVKHGYLEYDYTETIDLPKLEQTERSGLSQSKAERLLEFAFNYPYETEFLRHRNHAIFSVFIFAGLRKSELINLKVTDVDLEARTLFVRMGKGSKDRMIPINSALAFSLQRYLTERYKKKKSAPYFFVSAKRNSGLTQHGLKHLVDLMKRESGIAFSCHILRHSFARFMLEGGCDIYSLAKLMGHNDIRVTSGYLFASVNQLQSQITKHPLSMKYHN